MKSYLTPLALLVSSVFSTVAYAETQLFVTTSSTQDAQLHIVYPTGIRIGQAVQDGLQQLPLYNKTNNKEVMPIYWLGAA